MIPHAESARLMDRLIQVLVADDDPQRVQTTCGALEKIGYQLTTANSGTAALEALRVLPISLMLLNRHLPDIDGHALCRAIKADPALREVLVLITADAVDATESDELTGLMAGADGYLARPISDHQLGMRVAAYARLVRMGSALRAQAQELTVKSAQLERQNELALERTTELSRANAELIDFRRATLNLLDDEVEAARRVEAANCELQTEIAERRRAESAALAAQEQTASLLRAAQEARRTLLSVVEDQKETARALKQQKALSETILEHAPIGFSVHSISDGHAQYVSARFEEIYGQPRGTLGSVDDHFNRVFPDPDFRAKMRARIEADIGSGDPARMRWENIPITTASGEQRQVTAINIPLFDQDLMVSSVMDVTERVRAEQQLRASLHEKSALLKEVHHRVKNNLQVITSLLRLEANRSKETASKAVLREMQGRILSMALLHEMLYRSSDFSAVDLGNYLRQLVTQLFRAQNLATGRVQLRMELQSIPVEMDQAIPCGLIVNELVTNCLKHGFPDERVGEVSIGLDTQADGQVRLKVSDDGVGLPAGFDLEQATTLGLQLATDLSRQLGGKLTIGAGQQAEFTTTFPATDTQQAARTTGTS